MPGSSTNTAIARVRSRRRTAFTIGRCRSSPRGDGFAGSSGRRCAHCARRAGTERSDLELPDEDVAEHDEVAREAVERVLERRRPVLLEHEVTDPREAVAED